MTDGERAIIETKSQAARESAEAAMLADMDDKPTLDELPGLLAVELATVGRALSSVSRNIICGILDDAVGRAKAAEDERDALRAELEAQQAAQQWRPVTEDWPPYNERVIIGHGGGYGGGWSAFARRVRTDNRDDWLMDDDTTLAFESAVVAMRRPLPPAPQETE